MRGSSARFASLTALVVPCANADALQASASARPEKERRESVESMGGRSLEGLDRGWNREGPASRADPEAREVAAGLRKNPLAACSGAAVHAFRAPRDVRARECAATRARP